MSVVVVMFKLLLLSSSSIDFSLADAPQCGLHLRGTNEGKKILAWRKMWGGEILGRGEFPWLVAVHTWNSAEQYPDINKGYICTGTILDDWHVITAQHCMRGVTKNKHIVSKNKILTYEADIAAGIEIKVVLNELNKNAKEKDEIVMGVTKVFFPRNYDGNLGGATIGNYLNLDMAILKLDKSLKFYSKVMPICLPKRGERGSRYYKHCFAAGWGTSEEYNPSPRRADVTYLNDEECYKKINMIQKKNSRVGIKNLPKFPGRFWSKICAVGNGTSICPGDSGGPLVCTHNGDHYEIIGVASYTLRLEGIGHKDLCEMNARNNYPSVYFKISLARPWIVAVTTSIESAEDDGVGNGATEKDWGTLFSVVETNKTGGNSTDSTTTAKTTAGSSILTLLIYAFFF